MKIRLIYYMSILILCACAQQHKPFVAYEKIDRGVVALQINETHAYVGWRLLREDPEDVAFNVYRRQVGLKDFIKVNSAPVNTSTNYVDSTVRLGQSYRYRIGKLTYGKEVETPGEGTVFIAGQAEFDKTGASIK